MSTQEEKLQAIADAIREKDGTTELIPANDFPERIRAIQGGGWSFAVPLEAAAEAGTTITAINGNKIITGVTEDNETALLTLTSPGDWSISAQLGDTVRGPEIISVDAGYAIKFLMFSCLPEGYTEVKYIQSSGYAYIDTGIKPDSAAVTIDFEPLATNTTTTPKYAIYSVYNPASSTAKKYFFYLTWSSSGVVVATTAKSTGTASTTVLSSDTTPRRMVAGMDAPNETAFILGETEINRTFSASSLMNNIYLLASSASTGALAAKLYACQISTSGELVRDFVPCIAPSGAVGLFDLVTVAFYPNAGTGTFIAGPAV